MSVIVFGSTLLLTTIFAAGNVGASVSMISASLPAKELAVPVNGRVSVAVFQTASMMVPPLSVRAPVLI